MATWNNPWSNARKIASDLQKKYFGEYYGQNVSIIITSKINIDLLSHPLRDPTGMSFYPHLDEDDCLLWIQVMPNSLKRLVPY